MSAQQQTLTRPDNRPNETLEPIANSGGNGESPVLAQAAGFAKVAREARQNCDRGEDAERELEKRQNISGE